MRNTKRYTFLGRASILAYLYNLGSVGWVYSQVQWFSTDPIWFSLLIL